MLLGMTFALREKSATVVPAAYLDLAVLLLLLDQSKDLHLGAC